MEGGEGGGGGSDAGKACDGGTRFEGRGGGGRGAGDVDGVGPDGRRVHPDVTQCRQAASRVSEPSRHALKHSQRIVGRLEVVLWHCA